MVTKIEVKVVITVVIKIVIKWVITIVLLIEVKLLITEVVIELKNSNYLIQLYNIFLIYKSQDYCEPKIDIFHLLTDPLTLTLTLTLCNSDY